MRRWAEPAGALLASAAVLFLAFQGAGPLPALGPAFNPTRGVWSAAADARAATPETIRLNGLRHPVEVVLEADGVPHITAQDDLDLFRTLGYLHARYRLFQMDLMRRQGEGRLSEVVGAAALDNDRFELQLGLLRTAQAEWAQASPESREIVLAYTDGVNQRESQELRTGQLPMLFRLLGYEPGPWQPVDTYVIKGVMTQDLDFQTSPLDAQLLVKGLGLQRTEDWIPILAANEQHPYDLTQHAARPPAALPTAPGTVSDAEAATSAALLDRLAGLPAWAPGAAQGGNSNNWAVDAAKSADGHALLAGDPHLGLTLPAIWYQVAGDSPGYSFQGVGIPGTPGIIIGRNRHIAWSLTNTQNQATFYYEEETDAGHPDQYFWNGSWRKFEHLGYEIPVKGGAAQHLDVRLSVHGPVITQQGLTYAVYWLGDLPSPDLEVLSQVTRASDFAGFREALRGWHAPSQNFVYADDRGNIGLVSAGWYPQVKQGRAWLPMPGTGEYDVTGTVPFEEVPQVSNPPDHFTFSANQREVGPDYPYYIGTSLTDFDPGYRADEIHRVLSATEKVTAADMQALQNDDRDYLASRLVPKLLDALDTAPLLKRQAQARDLLESWDYVMGAGSGAAALWWTFLEDYLHATFQPWFEGKVKGVTPDTVSTPLIEDLEAWTLNDPANAAFTTPQGEKRTAPDVMRSAFESAVEKLTSKLGPDPAKWTWGAIHHRAIPSLAAIDALGYGPFPSRGDRFTPDAAGGDPATSGPSWRFVVDFGGRSYGVVPGGQSENPVSDWYDDRVAAWWDGRYQPLLSADEARAAPGSVTWSLRP